MPIEIKELHIRVTVNQSKQEEPPVSNLPAASKEDKEKLLADCVEQVFDLMNNKKER